MKKTILIILLFSSLARAQFWENPNQKPSLFGMRTNRGHLLGNPAGLWLMSEGFGTKVYDLSGNGRHSGAFQGDAISWVADTPGWTIDFGGADDFFVIPYRPTHGVLSVACWINFDNVATRMGIGMHDGNDHRLYLGINGVNCYFGLGTAFKDTVAHGLSANNWYLLVITCDGSVARYYIDGVELDSFAYTWTGTSAHDFRVGEISSGGQDFNGSIASLIIWERCFSTSEIASLYRKPFCFMEPNWDMELYGWMTAPALGAGQFININMN